LLLGFTATPGQRLEDIKGLTSAKLQLPYIPSTLEAAGVSVMLCLVEGLAEWAHTLREESTTGKGGNETLNFTNHP